MRIFIIALLLAISYAQTDSDCKNFGRTVDGACECTPNYTGATCKTRRTYKGWQWFVIWMEGETCADRGYFPIRKPLECLEAARELYNWDTIKVGHTQFDEEGFPGCWTTPDVESLNLDSHALTQLVELSTWATKKLVCKHLLDEAVPPQVKSRLVDGTTGQPSEDNRGLLQVWYLDWNYWIGDTSEQDLDAVANLACVEMGYSGVASLRGNQWTPNKFHDAVDEILISDFDCLGSETSLFQCDFFKGFGSPDSAIEVTCSSEALGHPTADPTRHPTFIPTFNPTFEPSATPTINPTANPTADPTASTPKPIVDTGNCAWEKHWFWGGDDEFCSCPGGFVKIGRWGFYSEWQKVEGAGVKCQVKQLGDPLWGVTKECRCGQRGGKVENNRRTLKIQPLA